MIIKYYAYYRNYTGCKEEILPLAPLTAIELLKQLSQLHGKPLREKVLSENGEKIHLDVIFLINGRNIDFLEGDHSVIEETDTVSLFPRIAGG